MSSKGKEIKFGQRVCVKFLENPKEVIVIRHKAEGVKRAVNVPVRLIDYAVKNLDALRLGEEIHVDTKWRIGTTSYGEEEYVTFSAYNDNDERIG